MNSFYFFVHGKNIQLSNHFNYRKGLKKVWPESQKLTKNLMVRENDNLSDMKSGNLFLKIH